jgi:hypothetical protein
MKSISTFAAAMLVFSVAAADADAASIRVKCEKRANRSSVSVDGRNLVPGNYSAKIMSGDNTAEAPLAPSVGDEAEFDFDSARNDIAAGDTPISRTFIQGGQVRGQILDDEGFIVIEGTAACRIR